MADTKKEKEQAEKVVKKRKRRSVEEIIADLEKKLEKAKMQQAKTSMQYLAKVGMKTAELLGEPLPTDDEETDRIISILEGIITKN